MAECRSSPGCEYTRPIAGAGTVLVVDDDASIRLLCRINLELDGYRVVEAGTPDEVRTAIAAERVDALLLDLHLGPVDARPLVAELRRDNPELGIVLMTGSTDSVVESVAADAVLTKPFELDVFRSAVARAAGARRPQV